MGVQLYGTEDPVSGACGKNELGSGRNGAFRERSCSLYRGRPDRVLGEQESVSACRLSNVLGACEIEEGCSGGLQGSVPDDGRVGEADTGIAGPGEVLQGRTLEKTRRLLACQGFEIVEPCESVLEGMVVE